MSVKAHNCHPERIAGFLDRSLGDSELAALEDHLGECLACRKLLGDQTAAAELWHKAGRYLRNERDETGLFFETTDLSPTQDRSHAIEVVLNSLRPTDDPEMLGRLGGLEVSGVVGTGAMGVVLKAFDNSLDRTVAVKVMAPHLASSGAARKRFAREAKAAAAVLHPNVLAIHSVSNDESLPYLVMPYCRGASLQKRLDQEGPLPLAETLRIGSQIAAGLAAAHAQGLVHRDIKPANILLEEGVERVAITDFGLARAVDDATMTRSGVLAGTPQYMSPEQARGDLVDQRSDQFSLGSLLYATCTGRIPFRAETSYGVLRRVTDEVPRPIREINPDVPEWLCAIVTKLMSKSPEDRFESAEQVAELLNDCLAHVQQPTNTQLPDLAQLQTTRIDSPVERTTILRKGVIIMIAALTVGLFGMFLWQFAGPPNISGDWTGEDWGQVVLEEKGDGHYEGSFTSRTKPAKGSIKLNWSRVERRFNGTWREGEDRHGKISVRLVAGELRGAWTTSNQLKTNSEGPELSDLLWVRARNGAVALPTGDEQPQGAVRVLCIDATGKPVEGAEVHLFQGIDDGRDRRYLHFGPLPSDVNGEVLFSQARFSNSLGDFDRWVYARVPGKLVGVGRSARWKSTLGVINPDARVKMMTSRSVEGRITVPEGFDPTSVTVRIRTIHIATGNEYHEYESFPRDDQFPGLDTSLPHIFECRPDQDGSIAFHDVPVRGNLILATSGKGLGEAQWRNNFANVRSSDERMKRSFDQLIEINIKTERLLSGQVLAPTGEPVSGVQVFARISPPAAVPYLSTFHTSTNDAGNFVLTGLPDTGFVLSLIDPARRWVFRPLEGVQTSAEPSRPLNLKMERGTKVSGKVVDSNGNPVWGAALSLVADTLVQPSLDHVMTDDKGRYSLTVPSGRSKLYYNSLPDGFKYPEPRIIKHFDIPSDQAPVSGLDFALEKHSENDK